MVGLTRRVGDGGDDVLPLEEGVVTEDLLEPGARGQQVENVADAQALAANAGLPPALAGFDRDAGEEIAFHGHSLDANAPAARAVIPRGVGCEASEEEIDERWRC